MDNPILQKIRDAALSDPEYQKLLSLVKTGGSSEGEKAMIVNYSSDQDCLYFRLCLCVPKDVSLRNYILFEAHDSFSSGHPGYVKTLNAVRKSYFWTGMKRDILNYVKRCLSCQRIKAERVKMPGRLEPLDIPEMKWECISMDFVTGLPTVQNGYDSIMVVVDMLTKVSHLIPVKTTFTTVDIARLFVKEIYRIHGLPRRIISDRDAKFTSKFWTSLFQAIGTQLCFSSAYHPQTDGQTERVNQVIEDILRAYCSREPKKWIQYLPLAEYAYNSSYHTSIDMTPFKALYGQDCLSPLNLSDPTIRVEASKQMLEDMDQQVKAVRKDIQAAKDR